MVIELHGQLINLSHFCKIVVDKLGSERGAKIVMYATTGRRLTIHFTSDKEAQAAYDRIHDLLAAEPI